MPAKEKQMNIIFWSKDPGDSVEGLSKELKNSFGITSVITTQLPNDYKDHFVIHWGQENYSKIEQQQLFEKNKVPGLEYTTKQAVANTWLNEGHRVVERHRVKSSKGNGIRVVGKGEKLNPETKLYTKYFKHLREFRVNVWKDKVLLVTEKKRNPGVKNYNPFICSDEGGWTWHIHGLEKIPPQVHEVAVAAVKALGYQHGGVDIGYNQYYNMVRVFEVNTSPWLGKIATRAYASVIAEEFSGKMKKIKDKEKENQSILAWIKEKYPHRKDLLEIVEN